MTANASFDNELEHKFEGTKHNIGKNTKEMVSKIFKAASNGD